jgi:hypothetical protein
MDPAEVSFPHRIPLPGKSVFPSMFMRRDSTTFPPIAPNPAIPGHKDPLRIATFPQVMYSLHRLRFRSLSGGRFPRL